MKQSHHGFTMIHNATMLVFCIIVYNMIKTIFKITVLLWLSNLNEGFLARVAFAILI